MALPAALGLSQGFSNVDLNCAASCRGEACVAEQTLNLCSQGNKWRFVPVVRSHLQDWFTMIR